MARRPSVSDEAPDTNAPAPKRAGDASAPKRRSRRQSIILGLAIIAGIVTYAYGFEVTKVDLGEISSETRRGQLIRVLRDIARPELLTYDRIPTNTEFAIYLPCPAGGFEPIPLTEGRRLVVEPACAEPGDSLLITGLGFAPNSRGSINQVPPSGDLELKIGEFFADIDGNFEVEVDSRERADAEAQSIRVVTNERIGTIFSPVEVESSSGELRASPRVSRAVKDTWDKIIETVFLALLATTLGTALAVPLSFFAARNLMRDITTTVTKLSLQLLAIPLGVVVGVLLSRTAQQLADQLVDNKILLVAGLLVVPAIALAAIRYAFPPVDDEPPTPTERGQRGAVALVAAVAGILGILLVSELLIQVGGWLDDALGSFGFLGSFLEKSGEIATAITTMLSAILGAAVFASLAGRLSTFVRSRVSDPTMQAATYPLAALAGAVLGAILGAGTGWLYRVTDPMAIYGWPAVAGAVIGLILALRNRSRSSVQIGLVTYYLARTIFNTLRSIEPLVMVIVFVVWVGIGPFAGALALAIHTVAALAKLYSEQVESISEGPIEAVKATGATRLQTVVYAVAPQIVPPYIAFTLYRWDINVRMSTIIGFAGGGGIGFVLQQNIRLLEYSAASVNMLAIAIVVASMDYLSSRIRERVV